MINIDKSRTAWSENGLIWKKSNQNVSLKWPVSNEEYCHIPNKGGDISLVVNLAIFTAQLHRVFFFFYLFLNTWLLFARLQFRRCLLIAGCWNESTGRVRGDCGGGGGGTQGDWRLEARRRSQRWFEGGSFVERAWHRQRDRAESLTRASTRWKESRRSCEAPIEEMMMSRRCVGYRSHQGSSSSHRRPRQTWRICVRPACFSGFAACVLRFL